MSALTVSVVICTLGRPDPLRRALTSLAASEVRPLEVLVIDGTDEGEGDAATVVRDARSELPARHVRHPRGLCRQRNAGADLAMGEVVLFMDDDARVRPDSIGRLLSAFDDRAVVGATGRVVEPTSNRIGGKTSRVRILLRGRSADGTFTASGFPRRLIDEGVTTDVEFMSGCFMSARTDVARFVRFDEALVGYALAEDEDFSCRLLQHGRLRYVGDAVIDHDNVGFHSRDRRAFGHEVVRNRWYLFRKNFPYTRTARLRFEAMIVILVVHRLLNGDALGARGLAEAALRRPRPATPFGHAS